MTPAYSRITNAASSQTQHESVFLNIHADCSWIMLHYPMTFNQSEYRMIALSSRNAMPRE